MTQTYVITAIHNSMRQGSLLLWKVSIVLMFGMVTCMVLSSFDSRLIAGVSVWAKPAKFFLSLGVQALTLSWALSLLPKPARGVTVASWAFVAALTMEMAYMIFRASRGEASHFNVATPFAAVMYAVMGVGALTLTGVTGFIGWRVWQQRGTSVLREAAGVGLMLGAVLGTLAGVYMSAQTGHAVGGDYSDGSGLRFFNWSTTGGDLRVAHFIGLHTSQLVPLAAMTGQRWAVWLVAGVCVLLTCITFFAAYVGIPLLRL
jgi:hypothetical protein